jgi:deoxycytidylate deaminase
MTMYELDWADLAFGSKKAVRELKATFIAAPREISDARFKQLVKAYLPLGNVILGIAKEPYLKGFEGQPQYKTLDEKVVKSTITRVNAKSPHKVYVLRYSQSDAPHLYETLKFKRVVLINGSWLHSFHLRKDHHALQENNIPYELVSPFADEDEAKTYARALAPKLAYTVPSGTLTEHEVLQELQTVAQQSYDTSFQIGVILAKKHGDGYVIELARHNVVVPYETFAWHHGAARERHHSQPGDLNHYDTIHGEAALLLDAGQSGISLKGKTVFINVLPCPSCARNFCYSDIAELVYSLDHSNGYAVAMLEAAGKTIRRVVNLEDAI